MGSPILTTTRFSELASQMDVALERYRAYRETLPNPRIRHNDLQELGAQFQPRFEAIARVVNELGNLQKQSRLLFRNLDFLFQQLCDINAVLKTELSGRSAEVAIHEVLTLLKWRGVVSDFLYAEPFSDLDRQGIDFLISIPDAQYPCPLQVKASEVQGIPFRQEQEELRKLAQDDPDLCPFVPIEVIITHRQKNGHSVPKPRRILVKELRRMLNRWKLQHLPQPESVPSAAEASIA